MQPNENESSDDTISTETPSVKGSAGDGADPAAWPPTATAIAEALALLIGPGQTFEIRTIKGGADGKDIIKSRTFTSGTIDRAARQALAFSGVCDGVYFTLNPVRPDLADGSAARDVDILRRRLILIDCDPTRPARTSATDAEKRRSLERALAIRDFLRGLGWPEPVLCDSGNGYHLLYLIDLPADDGGLVKGVLEALAARFDTDACTIDRKVANASRISKLYGTKVRKGEDTAERPHRFSRILKAPAEFRVVPEDLLRALAAEKPPAAPPIDPVEEKEIERGRARDAAGAKGRAKRVCAGPRGGRPDAETRAMAYLARCDPAIEGQDGSGRAFKAACKVGPGFDLPPEVSFRLLLAEYNPRCQPPWSEKELRHKVEDSYKVETRRGWLLDAGRNGHRDGPPGAAAKGKAECRPEIEITPQRHEVLAQTVKALPGDPDLYRRGDMLVTVAEEEADSIHLTKKTLLANLLGSPKVLPLAESVLGCMLTRDASFYHMAKARGGETYAVDVHPPDWLINAVLNLKRWPGVRPLLAVAECPYPRPDGSIVEAAGYDPTTGTLYRPAIPFPPVPDRPTQEDARAAWGRLKQPIRQFPFAGPDDEVVWLAGLLTAIARPAIPGPVPGVALNGNKAGCGKGLLVEGIGIIACGRPTPNSTYPDEKEEASKVKVAIALSGKAIVHFDNLDEGSTYGNSGIDSALTSIIVDDRILGSNRNTGEIALRVTWFLSGNNVSPAKDAYRRWLPCNLVTELERPEERSGIEIEDLRGHLLEHRGEYVRDALTILKAHALVDRPRGGWAPLGSFEIWDKVIRGAVWYATGRDCCATRRKAADESPDRQDKLALLDGWLELPGVKEKQGITASAAVKLVTESPNLYPILHNALMAYGRDGKLATSRAIGNKIRGMRGNVIGGKKFVEAGVDHNAVFWSVSGDRKSVV